MEREPPPRHEQLEGAMDRKGLVIVRGNPGVQNLNTYRDPTLHKPLPLVKGKGFEGSGSGFWRVEGYKGFVKGLS